MIECAHRKAFGLMWDFFPGFRNTSLRCSALHKNCVNLNQCVLWSVKQDTWYNNIFLWGRRNVTTSADDVNDQYDTTPPGKRLVCSSPSPTKNIYKSQQTTFSSGLMRPAHAILIELCFLLYMTYLNNILYKSILVAYHHQFFSNTY